LRVLLVGDSVAETLAPSLSVGFDDWTHTTGLPHAKVESTAFPGFGFASSLPGIVDGKKTAGFKAFRDVPKLIDHAIAQYDPDVVVALLGSWDMVRRKVHGNYINPTACEWSPWYGKLADRAREHLTAQGAVVAWLAFPCTVQEENPYHFALNAVFRSIAGAHPSSVAYVDFDRFVCPEGHPVRKMQGPDGKLHTVRATDSTHFEFYGAPPVVGPFFGRQFARLLTLPG
jgi:hypothetical protein